MPDIIPIGLLPAAASGGGGPGPYTTIKRRLAGDRIVSLVNEADFSAAHTLLIAATAGVPIALPVSANNLIGRGASGNISSLDAATVRSILNVANGSQANAGTQLVASGANIGNIFKQLSGAGAHEYRGLQTGSPTILALSEDGTLVTLTITPAGINLGDLGNVDTTGAILDDVLQFDGANWVPAAVVGGGGGLDNLVEDLTPQLGGNLDVNGNSIVSLAGVDIDIAPAAGRDVNITTSGAGALKVNGNAALPVNTGAPTRGDIIAVDATDTYAALGLGPANWVLGSDGTDLKYIANTKQLSVTLQNPIVRTYGIGFLPLASTVIRYAYSIDGDASASATFTLRFGGMRFAAGSELFPPVTAATAGPVQSKVESSGWTDNTVPGANFIWIDISAVAGVIDTLEIALGFQEN